MKTSLLISLLISAASTASAELTLEQVRSEINQALDARKTKSGAAAISIFNPAMGLTLDAAAQHTRESQGAFKFRSAELNFESAVDPRAKIYAVINATPDEIEAEEAAFQTTSLPYNLTLRGGRFFANFGRLPKWHDHELPMVERTESLERMIGGEARMDGLELTHLFRTPFFLQGTIGAGNALGSENDRLSETSPVAQAGHANGRPLSSFTYNARLFTYAPLGDDWGLDLGLSGALTPRQFYIGGVRADEGNNARLLSAADVTLRWEPLSQNVYRKALWSTEIFRNNERRRAGVFDATGTQSLDSNGNPIFQNERKTAWGLLTHFDWRFAAHWSAGGFFDLAEDLDVRAQNTRTYGALLSYHVSEFQRIRLQISNKRNNFGGRADGQVFVQYIASIGSHVHVFKDR